MNHPDFIASLASIAITDPAQTVAATLDAFGDSCGISFSGAEDVLLVEYAAQWRNRSGKAFRVFSLDTGRLHPETYRCFAAVEERYGIRIEYCLPEAAAVQDLVRRKGQFSFLSDGHKECCDLRKVAPLKNHLATLNAWITGQRKDQSPTRSAVPHAQTDPVFRGRGDAPLMKVNPLWNTSSTDTWLTIRALDVPYNALHERGFVSIGCEPCTRPVLPGQHEREGRWWWEDSTRKECGLHAGNLK